MRTWASLDRGRDAIDIFTRQPLTGCGLSSQNLMRDGERCGFVRDLLGARAAVWYPSSPFSPRRLPSPCPLTTL
jgi:hypothetical protein